MLARIADIAVTLVAWAYFLGAFCLLFAPLYLAACLLPRRQGNAAFQRLNHWYFRGFFALLRRIAPRQEWRIDPRLREARGCVILCNHLSYLDPLIMLAALPRAATVAKARLFLLPIFGWVLKQAGYVPASSEGPFAGLMLTQLEGLREHLATGGTLFIFPEGSRSRDGKPGPLQAGALKLARLSGAPLRCFRVENSGGLYAPGHFRFDAHTPRTISITFVGEIAAEDALYSGPLAGLRAHIQQLLSPSPEPGSPFVPANTP